ncbi:DnaJ domain-containing protein [Methylomonas sp. SURF-2]|uniref:DnaJ domain-containing protein n=1 Tax=Methylomonas subterranea TaxID=2952225 RepID=A0ABT1TEY2_9GAMM|nr:DnaJ C-terminal domain-containing protein [Methylomonas sp. SURF-2]MCQ8104031.1 DnaJ domain-containing protein [Methylomonas sp. SURF-2]
MQYKDYYQILGVKKDAALADIKKAFRKLARKYHPDVSKEADAEAKMKEVNEAYTVLSDVEKRAAYDQLGRGYRPGQEFNPPPNWDAGFEFSGRGFNAGEAAEFSDFFAELFGKMRGGQSGEHARGNFSARGEDHHAKVMLDLEDSFKGASRQIGLRVPRMDRQGRMVLENRLLNIKIPQGVYEGRIVRLAGQGSPGLGDGKAGDLLLEVCFNPHPRFKIDGRNLHLTLPVAPWEAALGAMVTVNLIDSQLKVRIPEGTQSGKQLRLVGKGIPGQPPGDLLLTVQVVLPPANTEKARQFYQTMARELAFDPRATRS